ncbi:uncharacterized protein LOC132938829 [Metopolophium dirhodum]|uniref:uncharacterized protein LOC132938829 n=1 Tax=Metopolophium dirhodum TaxID=44670 RepID=UPI0029905448|nr:uncharacterized protein LOC132938829 [Metopolophium dirhodum]
MVRCGEEICGKDEKQNRCSQEITTINGKSIETEFYYDENKFRNAVVTYYLSKQNNADKKKVMKDWLEFKKIYYEYQLAVFDKMKKSNGYLIISNWCIDNNIKYRT